MSIAAITIIIVLFLMALIATGYPVMLCMLSISVIGIAFWIKPAALSVLSSVVFTTSTVDTLIALPMFIFMASVLEISGLGSAMYDMMYKWMAGLRGGLAMGTVLIATFMAAFTGAAATATVSMGLFAYPEMRKRGYSKTIAIGCIPAGGCLGPIIPPSIPMILVAALSSISIGRLFIAGVFPGLMISFFFILYIGIRCLRNPALGPPIPLDARANWGEKFVSLRSSILPIILIFSVLGMVYLGICTPSEAGGVGAFGALVCAAIYRNLNLKKLNGAIKSAFTVNAMVFWLIITGSLFSTLLGITGVTRFISEFIVGMGGRWTPMIIMMAITFVMGMFMDGGPIIIICVPIFIPIVRALGFDPLWFGLIFTLLIVIGLMTPPFGLVMFYFHGLRHPGVTMADIYRSCIPFVLCMVLALALCVIFPQIVVWLPGTMIK